MATFPGPFINSDLNADNAALHHLQVGFLAVAICNSVELLFWIFNYFKRRQGLYFWSLLVATLSIIALMILKILAVFTPISIIAAQVLLYSIEPTVVVSQSLVLYSRLHLISRGRIIKVLFWFIIVSTITIFLTLVLCSISYATQLRYFPALGALGSEGYLYSSPAVLDIIICGIYVFEAFRQLKPVIQLKGQVGRTVMIHLILVSTASIVFDIFMALLYWVVYLWWTARGFWGGSLGISATGFVMSFKLKMEFTILNRLVALLQAPAPPPGLPSFVNPSFVNPEAGAHAQMTGAANTGVRTTSTGLGAESIRGGTSSTGVGTMSTGTGTGTGTDSTGFVVERVKLPDSVYQSV